MISLNGMTDMRDFVRSWRTALAGVVLGVALLAPVSAGAITKKVETNCRKDYSRFCSKYSLGTTALRKCMESNGRRLSRKCKRALVDAGMVRRRSSRRR